MKTWMRSRGCWTDTTYSSFSSSISASFRFSCLLETGKTGHDESGSNHVRVLSGKIVPGFLRFPKVRGQGLQSFIIRKVGIIVHPIQFLVECLKEAAIRLHGILVDSD